LFQTCYNNWEQAVRTHPDIGLTTLTTTFLQLVCDLQQLRAFKPVTDEHVFYDKFLCDKFYLPSERVYMPQILYDKFSYDKFYLLV
jgi:hypothetical protein